MNAVIREIENKLAGTLRELGLKARYVHSANPGDSDDEVVFEDADGRRSVVSLQVHSLVDPSLANAAVIKTLIGEADLGNGWTHRGFIGIEHAKDDGNVIKALDEALRKARGSFEPIEGKPEDRVMSHPLTLEVWTALARIDGIDMSFSHQDGAETVGFSTPAGQMRIVVRDGMVALHAGDTVTGIRNGSGVDFATKVKDAVILAGGFRREETMKLEEAVERAVWDWRNDGDRILWEDELVLDGGGFVQRHVLLHDPSGGQIRILRAWISAGQDAAALSVDLEMDAANFCGEIDEADFPHRPTNGSRTQSAFRANMPAEHVEILWANETDAARASYVGRSAKVGRGEHLVAASVDLTAPGDNAVRVSRLPLEEVAPKRTPHRMR